MVRTRIALAAAVATLTIGTVALLPSAAVAATPGTTSTAQADLASAAIATATIQWG